jgi:malonyl CoA-acyl carrier protein transacylase
MTNLRDPRPERVVFAFPGIGVEPCGHEIEFIDRHPRHFATLFADGSAAAGNDLLAAFGQSGFARLSERDRQLFTYCYSVGMARALEAGGLAPVLVAGYSFGIYAALVSSGALDFSQGLTLVDGAYQAMARQAAAVETALMGVVGLSRPQLDAIVAEPVCAGVAVVNSANEHCHVLCGPDAAVRAAAQAFEKADAISVTRFDVTLPYHHPVLAAGAIAEFGAIAAAFPWQRPRCGCISTLDGRVMHDPGELREFTVRHLAAAMDWHRVTRLLHADATALFIECGPGISLCQNARFVPGGAGRWINLKTILPRIGL